MFRDYFRHHRVRSSGGNPCGEVMLTCPACLNTGKCKELVIKTPGHVESMVLKTRGCPKCTCKLIKMGDDFFEPEVFKKAIERYKDSPLYSKWMAVPNPIKVTSVKPDRIRGISDTIVCYDDFLNFRM